MMILTKMSFKKIWEKIMEFLGSKSGNSVNDQVEMLVKFLSFMRLTTLTSEKLKGYSAEKRNDVHDDIKETLVSVLDIMINLDSKNMISPQKHLLEMKKQVKKNNVFENLKIVHEINDMIQSHLKNGK